MQINEITVVEIQKYIEYMTAPDQHGKANHIMGKLMPELAELPMLLGFKKLLLQIVIVNEAMGIGPSMSVLSFGIVLGLEIAAHYELTESKSEVVIQ